MEMELQIARERRVQLHLDWLLVVVLSATAGAVDVIGFLALGGLFTAHITGNLMVLAAHYVTGHFSQIGPLLSVPVFVAVLGIVSALFVNRVTRGTRRTLLVLQVVLLGAFLGFGVGYGPFTNPDSAMAVFVGMLGVAAMATQNALVRLDLVGFPSTAVVTTNNVQVTVDLAVLVCGLGDPEYLARARRRARLTLPSVGDSSRALGLAAFLKFISDCGD
jgi:uncharacterized membrane protein YoaK (UPF0700 family)